jgi:hypothetical protein
MQMAATAAICKLDRARPSCPRPPGAASLAGESLCFSSASFQSTGGAIFFACRTGRTMSSS